MSNEEILLKTLTDEELDNDIRPIQRVLEAMNLARIEAIKECAERAKTKKLEESGDHGSWYDAEVDKQSILSLIDEIK